MSGPPNHALPPMRTVGAEQQGRAFGALKRIAVRIDEDMKGADASDGTRPDPVPAVTRGGPAPLTHVAKDVTGTQECVEPSAEKPQLAKPTRTAQRQMTLGELATTLASLDRSDDVVEDVSVDWNPGSLVRERQVGAPMSGAAMAAKLVRGMKTQ